MGSEASALGSNSASGYLQVLGESLNLSEPAIPELQHLVIVPTL